MRHNLVPAAILMSLVGAAPALARGTSPTWAEMSGVARPDAARVVQYLDLADDSRLVILDAGADAGVVAGSTFKTYRSTERNVRVQTGRLKAIEVQPTYSVATVVEQGSAMSRAFFPKFADVMAGDIAVLQRLTLARRQAVLPTVSVSYFEMFDDPKADPASFELSARGVAMLKEAAAAFAGVRLSMLMVEGYTDHHGSADGNQIESYQRALTVRQYLIDELGFDPARVVAVGFGEAEPADVSLAPGYVEANRRIVLKAVPLPR